MCVCVCVCVCVRALYSMSDLRGSQFSDQGSNLCPLQQKHRVLSIGLLEDSL